MRTAVLTGATDLAAGQWGLLTAAQAQSAGISRMQLARMVEAGILERISHGVYATPAVLGDELLPLRAAWLALQPARSVAERLADPTGAGVVSHASAAAMHRLGDLLADEHELTLPHRYQSTRAGLRVHRGDLSAGDVTVVAGLPVTTATRTVVDLLGAGHDLEHVGQVAADGVRQNLIEGRSLAIALEPVARRHGADDGPALAAQLLELGGLGLSDLGAQVASSQAGRDLMTRSLDERLTGSLSPEAVKTVEDLVALANAAAASPELRAVVSQLAARTRAFMEPFNATVARTVAPAAAAARATLAALPSPETRARMATWFEDPKNQAALAQLVDVLRVHAELIATAAAVDEEDVDVEVDEEDVDVEVDEDAAAAVEEER
jgi:Transcriptional regulator, AbiEi antitoxin